MPNNKPIIQFESFLKKRPEEVVQILTDYYEVKLPKDIFDLHSITHSITHPYANKTVYNIIGKKYLVQLEDSHILHIKYIKPEDDINIRDIKKGYHKRIGNNNPFGPAIVDLVFPKMSRNLYYINDKQLTEHQFTAHLVKQRTKALK